MGAHHPAAGKSTGGAIMVALAKAEAGEYLLGAGFKRVVLMRLNPGMVWRELRRREDMPRGDLQDGLVACRRVFLRQMTDRAAALPGERALVNGILARMMRKRVVLPVPFAPTSPKRLPRRIVKPTSANSVRVPKRLVMPASVSMSEEGQARTWKASASRPGS